MRFWSIISAVCALLFAVANGPNARAQVSTPTVPPDRFVERPNDPDGTFRLDLPGGVVEVVPDGMRFVQVDAGGMNGHVLTWTIRGAASGSWEVEEDTRHHPRLRSISSGGVDDVRSGHNLIRRQILHGVDLDLTTRVPDRKGLKYTFSLAPGVSSSSIRIDIAGADRLSIDATGHLLIETPSGSIVEEPPIAWQPINGVLRHVPVRFVLDGSTLGFAVGDLDPDHPLVIDPVLRFSTYLGGSLEDEGRGVAVDSDGSIITVARSRSLDFPTTPGAFRLRRDSLGGDFDIVVSRFDRTGRRLLWSTWIVGDRFDDPTGGVLLDNRGRVLVAGVTTSSTIPTSGMPVSTTPFGGSDGFLFVLRADGSALDYGSFLGGTGADTITSMTRRSDGATYLVGTTTSNDLSVPAGSLQESFGGATDLFVYRLPTDYSTVDAATWIGGPGAEREGRIVSTPTGVAVVATSDDIGWPVSIDAIDGAPIGGLDIVIADLAATLNARTWGSYFGGSGDDRVGGVSLDRNNNLLVTGRTASNDFPNDAAIMPSGSWFLTRFNSGSRQIDYSAIVSNDQLSEGTAVTTDASNRPLLAGTTSSRFFPTGFIPETIGPRGGADIALLRIRADGSGIADAVTVGGSLDDRPVGRVGRTPDGTLVVGGTTFSGDYPTSRFPLDGLFGGSTGATGPDAFLLGWRFDDAANLVGPGLFRLDTLDCDSTIRDTLWVVNTGNQPAMIEANLLETSGGPFRLVSPPDLTDIVVQPGDSVRYIVEFSTRDVGLSTNAILVYSTDSIGGRSPLRIPIEGLRNAPSIIANDLRFGSVATCTDSVQMLEIRNTWSGPVTVQRPAFSSGSSGYSLDGNPAFPIVIEPRSSRTIAVRFDPIAVGPAIDTMTFLVDECPSSLLDVELRGRGELVALGEVPDTIDVGQLGECDVRFDTTIGLTNEGSLPVTVTDVTLPGSDFTIIAPTFPLRIDPDDPKEITIRFEPSGLGLRTTVLSFRTSPCDTVRRVVLRGERIGEPAPRVEPDTVDFERITACPGQPGFRDTTIRLFNDADRVVDLGAIDYPDDFRFCGLQEPDQIASRSSSALCLRFSPAAEGASGGVVTIPYRRGTCVDTMRIVVRGELVEPILSIDEPVIDLGTIGPCLIFDTVSLRLRNPSESRLQLDSISTDPAITLLDPTLPRSIAVSDSLDIRLVVRPTSSGPFSIPVRLFYGPCGDTLLVTITGTASGAVPSFDRTSIDFGATLACNPPTILRDSAMLRLVGDAGDQVTIASARLRSDSGRIRIPDLDQLVGRPVTATGIVIPAEFSDSTFRRSFDTLEIVLEPCGDTLLLPLVGESVFPALSITSGQFGQVEVGSSREVRIVVENTSGVPLDFTYVASPESPYSVDTTGLDLPRRLAPGEFIVLPTDLTPERSGFYTDSISFVVGDDCTYPRTIRLDGEGINPVLTGTFCLRGFYGATARSGDTLEVPITADRLFTTGEPVDVEFDVLYDPTRIDLLVPLAGFLAEDDPTEGRATYRVLGATRFPDDLPVLRLRLLAGDRPFTTIQIDSVRLVGGSALRPLLCDTLAVVGIGNRCLVNGVRLGRFASRIALVRPNPVRDHLTIEYDQLEHVTTTMTILDASGREVLRPLESDMPGGRYELVVDVADLDQGVYFLVVRSGTFEGVERFVVTE